MPKRKNQTKSKQAKKATKKGGHAILMVAKNENNEIYVTEEGEEMFRSLPVPYSIAAVAGKYRTGKSLLLERALLQNDKCEGFKVGNTTNACTLGIWMYSEPEYNDDGVPVYAVDSEGLSAPGATSEHDTRIFASAEFISSLFIYNTKTAIDEDTLSNLSMVLDLLKKIVNENLEHESMASLSQYFPEFMITVRDCHLQLQNDEGQEINENEYLENALREQENSDKNAVRHLIKELFPERYCTVFHTPSVDTEVLNNLNNAPLEDMNPDFVEDMIRFRQKVLSIAKPKMFDANTPMQGSTFVEILKQFLHVLNSGEIPMIKNTYAMFVDIQCQQAKDYTLQHIHSLLKEYEDNLETVDVLSVMQSSMQKFDSLASGELTVQFRLELEEHLNTLIKETQERISQTLELRIRNALNEQFLELERVYSNLTIEFRDNFDQDTLSFKDYLKQFTRNEQLGPIYNNILNEMPDYIKNSFYWEMYNQMKKMRTEFENKLYLYAIENGTSKSELQKLELELQEYKEEILQKEEQLENLRTETEQLQTNEESYKSQIIQLEEQYNQLKHDQEQEIDQFKEEQETKYSTIMNEKREMESQIHQLQLNIKTLESQKLQLQSEIDQTTTQIQSIVEELEEKNELQLKYENLVETNETLEDEIEQYKQTMTDLKHAQEKSAIQAKEKFSENLRSLRNQLVTEKEVTENQMKELSKKYEKLKSDYTKLEKQLNKQVLATEKQNEKLVEEQESHVSTKNILQETQNELRSMRQTNREKMNELTEQNTSLEDANKRFEIEVQNLNFENMELKQKLNNPGEGALTLLKAKNDQLHKRLKDYEDKYDTMRTELRSSKREISSLESSNQSLQHELQIIKLQS